MLTENEINILEAVSEFTKNRGYAPTIRELMELCDIKSSSIVHYWLMKLKEKGYIMVEPNKSRTIKIIK